jgi:hypothetical protein
MTIEKRIEKYEILIRFNGDNITGCHFKDIEKIVENDVVISAREGIAQPISIQEIIDLIKPKLEEDE